LNRRHAEDTGLDVSTSTVVYSCTVTNQSWTLGAATDSSEDRKG
jgi:hypothetical protein